MRELNKLQTAIFLFGGILMAVGAGTTLLGWGSAPYIFAIGALGFSSMQMQQRYEGQNFTIRRPGGSPAHVCQQRQLFRLELYYLYRICI